MPNQVNKMETEAISQDGNLEGGGFGKGGANWGRKDHGFGWVMI